MTTDKKAKKTLEDLIDECIEYVDRTMEAAVDDANEVSELALDEYRDGDRYVGVPTLKATLLTAALRAGFSDPFGIDELVEVEALTGPLLDEEQRQLVIMLDHHCSMWAAAALRAKAKIRDTRHEIIGRLGDTDRTKMLQYLKRLDQAMAMGGRQVSRLRQLTGGTLTC